GGEFHSVVKKAATGISIIRQIRGRYAVFYRRMMIYLLNSGTLHYLSGMKPKGTLLLFFLLVQSSAGICQFKNIMLDDLGGQSASELTIAVNPRRPDNIVAASDRDYVYITTDAGKTWSKSQIAPGKSG